ncbi:MAG TPA: class I SAM-dependent methyltransferase [Rhodanobacter sp.]|nr:class I SAM-dependent methyltransferase [Rhodanobacter sp.]
MEVKAQLKRLAKKIPGTFMLAGAFQYEKFSRQLRKAEADYRKRGDRLVPPPMLRYRVHRALDEASYTRNGIYLSDLVAGHIKALFPQTTGLKVLDFACGPGRVIVGLKEKLPGIQLYGSDIDREAISWASQHLADIASFSRNELLPPATFATDEFDVIYSISLFTHLDEELQNRWLREMMRMLKPGGVLVATTHGALCTPACTPEELRQLDREGIVFRVGHRGRLKLDGLPDFYQTTFHTRDYVLRQWSEFGIIESYVEGGVNNHQDLVILRKPEASSHSAEALTAAAVACRATAG